MSIKEQFTTNLDRVSSSVKQAFNVATEALKRAHNDALGIAVEQTEE